MLEGMSDDFKKGVAITAGVFLVLIVVSLLFGRKR